MPCVWDTHTTRCLWNAESKDNFHNRKLSALIFITWHAPTQNHRDQHTHTHIQSERENGRDATPAEWICRCIKFIKWHKILIECGQKKWNELIKFITIKQAYLCRILIFTHHLFKQTQQNYYMSLLHSYIVVIWIIVANALCVFQCFISTLLQIENVLRFSNQMQWQFNEEGNKNKSSHPTIIHDIIQPITVTIKVVMAITVYHKKSTSWKTIHFIWFY